MACAESGVERALARLDLENCGTTYYYGSDWVIRKYLKRVKDEDEVVRK